jgi:hypothetical protein
MVFPKSMHLFIISQPLCDGSLFGDYVSEQDLEPSWLLGGSLLLRTPIENHHLRSTKPHHWRNLVGSLPQNHSCHPLVWNLVDLSPWASVSKVVCRYSTFLPILSHIECFHCNPKVECDSRVAIDCFQWPLLGRCLLEVYLAPCSLCLPFACHAALAIK